MEGSIRERVSISILITKDKYLSDYFRCLAEKDGDPASALAFFRQALENAPKNEEVITALLRVLDVLRQFVCLSSLRLNSS